MLIIRTISPNKFSVKGPPKLPIIRIAHIILKKGETLNNPLFNINLRECLRS